MSDPPTNLNTATSIRSPHGPDLQETTQIGSDAAAGFSFSAARATATRGPHTLRRSCIITTRPNKFEVVTPQ